MNSYILKINFLWDIWFANIFSHSIGCQFSLLIVSFAVDIELFSWYSPTCWFFLLLLVLLVSYPKIILKRGVKKLFPLYFFLSVIQFQVSCKSFFLQVLAVLGLYCCSWPFSTCGKLGLHSSCNSWASHFDGFACCRAWVLGAKDSIVAAHGLQSADSIAVMHRLSCPEACGFFPDQGLNPYPLHWQADS